MKRVTILGATGSVGRNVLDVIAHQRDAYQVEALVAGQDVEALVDLARRFSPRYVAVADERAYERLKDCLSGLAIACGAGRAAVLEAARRPCDLVVAGIVGTAGLEPTFAAVQEGRLIALANKECLVTAGAAFMRGVHQHHARLLPLDSEHNALFQVLEGHDVANVTQMVLTASGGPFRTWSAAHIKQASPADALAHPNWSMGPKITIDSASMMNKGLELIEAHHLFGVPADRLDVLVHPQSIVHGLVTFADGSMLAGMAPPDMRVPAAHCLSYPQRQATGIAPPDLARLGSLQFEPVDLERFPCLRLALAALRQDGGMACILNAANEIAVEAFLKGGHRFDMIARVVADVMDKASAWQMKADTMEACLDLDQQARALARTCLAA